MIQKMGSYLADALMCLAFGFYFWHSAGPIWGVFLGGALWLAFVVFQYLPIADEQEGEHK